MKQEIIEKVAAAGFDVYMRNPEDTYLLFTDGKNIGYLQDDRLEGVCLSTRHKPNIKTGTGFGIAQGLAISRLDKETLSRAFILAPNWASDVSSVKKYRDIEDLKKESPFNANYKLVAEGRK